MNRILQMISRKPRPTMRSTTAAVAETPVNREFFIDTDAPVLEAAPDQAPPVSRIKQLARTDRFQEGYRAGYDFHDLEVGHTLVERIKAEVRLALGEECDKLEGMISTLDRELGRLGEEPAYHATIRELQVQRDELERHRLTLEGQKLLVVGNDGFAELPVASFQAGFKQGYEKYLQETLFLNQYTR